MIKKGCKCISILLLLLTGLSCSNQIESKYVYPFYDRTDRTGKVVVFDFGKCVVYESRSLSDNLKKGEPEVRTRKFSCYVENNTLKMTAGFTFMEKLFGASIDETFGYPEFRGKTASLSYTSNQSSLVTETGRSFANSLN